MQFIDNSHSKKKTKVALVRQELLRLVGKEKNKKKVNVYIFEFDRLKRKYQFY